ncbi:stage III sporulation protein SpoIIIAB [Paenibacillus xerothermodurans]|uniref:Stage III sporulation protein AB n=1 Tax=Paenibacillus xerothermodurans TaxID=1977292 RepID=A0A2W1NG59_PAEXE|nr:stage III sporulation protein SpoIIIAB [Paenibacillus xerothermodurans]PZE22061.1 stage III sporulation protein AB [Paenibacillus xerothermodurans]
MMKLLGAMLILLSGTLFGFYKAQQYSRRPKQMADVIRGLQRLETEIVYGATPLPEALMHVSTSCAPPVQQLFRFAAEELGRAGGRSVQFIWRQAIAVHWKHTAMRSVEQDMLSQLGFTLGLSDSADQVKHIRLAVQQLQGEIERAQEERKQYEGMWRSLGLLIGALVVILMY